MKYFELYKSIYNKINYNYKSDKELEEIIQKDIEMYCFKHNNKVNIHVTTIPAKNYNLEFSCGTVG